MSNTTVFKYVLEPGVSAITIPEGAEILTVQVQREQLVLWALVDPTAPTEIREFRVMGTGHEIGPEIGPDRHTYVGTAQLMGGALVMHVFEWLNADGEAPA